MLTVPKSLRVKDLRSNTTSHRANAMLQPTTDDVPAAILPPPRPLASNRSNFVDRVRCSLENITGFGNHHKPRAPRRPSFRRGAASGPSVAPADRRVNNDNAWNTQYRRTSTRPSAMAAPGSHLIGVPPSPTPACNIHSNPSRARNGLVLIKAKRKTRN